MNNNMYNIPSDWYKEFNDTFMNYNNYNNVDKDDVGNIKEGFLRGNLFDNLYDPYKNYKYGELVARDKREELLYNILKYKFAMVELDLYLDMNPNDRSMIELYKKYMMEEKMLCEQYEKSYGPLTLDSMEVGTNKWNWIESPWPWEGRR